VSVAGLILAAGESRRMGFPKALLRYREETFLDTLIGLFAARCQPVIVVLGAHGDRIARGHPRPATFVVNPDYQRGQTTSMQCGLRAVPPEADGVLFTLVDHPAVAPARHHRCFAGRGRRRAPRCCACRATTGRRGHPIWFSRELIAEFLALPETGGGARHRARARRANRIPGRGRPRHPGRYRRPEAYGRLTGAAFMKLRPASCSRFSAHCCCCC
jgi:molybdenum cofactor cytidylyltransferase